MSFTLGLFAISYATFTRNGLILRHIHFRTSSDGQIFILTLNLNSLMSVGPIPILMLLPEGELGVLETW